MKMELIGWDTEKDKPPRAGLFIYSILRGWVLAQEFPLTILTRNCQTGLQNYSTHMGGAQAAFFGFLIED
jgi:hypothetical protein